MNKTDERLVAAVLMLACAMAPVLVAPAWAATESDGAPASSTAAAHRKVERDRIAREREVLTARRQQDEAVCYQRFAVEDCLRGVRAKAREAHDRLRAQEIELNDAERREKAAERLRAIEDKQTAVPPAGKRADAQVRKSTTDPEVVKTQREQDAHQRAQQQNSRAQTQASEQAARAAATADRAAQSRAKHAQALQAAEERRVRVERSKADALAQGRKPAASLPAPAASAPVR
ncbi:hypothetical protein OIN59_08745 [Acidovorax sp. D2M1]|uniref:Colicin import membrane protein n=1 Tax=Acidovorax benzenivorans TaxID=2987520 RepID=A0ABT5RV09_9BURK|nr:hypothetical protein [Acidovorax benzenivorans]MDD2177522.1 hypothetical protein [Acidovorax benzenivorans]